MDCAPISVTVRAQKAANWRRAGCGELAADSRLRAMADSVLVSELRAHQAGGGRRRRAHRHGPRLVRVGHAHGVVPARQRRGTGANGALAVQRRAGRRHVAAVDEAGASVVRAGAAWRSGAPRAGVDHEAHLPLLGDHVGSPLDEREQKLDQLLDHAPLFVVLRAQNGHIAPQRLVVHLYRAQNGFRGVLSVPDCFDLAQNAAHLLAKGPIDHQAMRLGGVVLLGSRKSPCFCPNLIGSEIKCNSKNPLVSQQVKLLSDVFFPLTKAVSC